MALLATLCRGELQLVRVCVSIGISVTADVINNMYVRLKENGSMTQDEIQAHIAHTKSHFLYLQMLNNKLNPNDELNTYIAETEPGTQH